MTTDLKSHEEFLNLAIDKALEAYAAGEVPVGCVIVCDGEVISSASNEVEKTSDPTCHAEIIAIKKAAKIIGKNLSDCTMYVTLEPCPMCAGAIVNAKIGALYYGVEEPKSGCCESLYNIVEDGRFNWKVKKSVNMHSKKCAEYLKKFFEDRR